MTLELGRKGSIVTVLSTITPAITTTLTKVIRNAPPNTLPIREKFRRNAAKIPTRSLTPTGMIRVNNEAISRPGTKKQEEPRHRRQADDDGINQRGRQKTQHVS